ncbi:carboxypeptidase-like regulatory domain-containing protein [Winogradskyella sp.]|uniref:carboxypeptidase-like regulatory domain-containing protein n=1 Tax=Winogradskyella sp. TaxID=1883156 RepID=UPI003BA9FA7F
MKPTKSYTVLLSIILLLFLSCQIDDGISRGGDSQDNIPDTFSEYFGNEISHDFIGTVIDINHNPIEAVTITIGNETVITDSNGVFVINNATVNERFGYVKAEKAGYIHGSRSVVPSSGTNKVTIMLLEATIVGSVTSGSASEIVANDGSSVSFDGNFIKEDGSAYSGSVDVIMHHLDPTDADMEVQMPGMLYAENEAGAERLLQTLGMLAVELRGSGGEDLNLAEGSSSEIKIPVDPSLMAIAPATIPLWYFDEAKGYWKEEGIATLQDGMYVGTVSHFSFWNCDIPAEAIMLCIDVVDASGEPLSHLRTSITSSIYGTRGGNTNDLGIVCGLVPSNETLELNIRGAVLCNTELLHMETIGPFNADSSITVTVLDNPSMVQETITGILNTCDGDPVTNGYVQISYDELTFYEYVSDGSFEVQLNRCSNSNSTFSVLGSDFSNYQTTESLDYTFTTPTTNIGVLNACLLQDEYIQYVIDDSIFVSYTDYIDVILGADRFVILKSTNGAFLADLPNEIGSYMVAADNLNVFNFEVPGSGYISMGQEEVLIDVTYVGNGIGDYININFSGTFMHDGITRSIAGAAHVRIDL